MGIYIKNEKMPTSCANCFYAIHCEVCIYKVAINAEEIVFYIGKKPDDCPLIEIDEEVFSKKIND